MYFGKLAILDKHLDWLSSQVSDTSLFLVGGVVRDVLIGRTFDPDDVDATCPGNPELLAEAVQTSNTIFQTKKYGTLTIVKKESDGPIHYEITPFRMEGGYTDHRHPDEIVWSDDLLEDSKRRDFTINSLYYTSIEFEQITSSTHPKSDDPTILSDQQLKKLGKDKLLYIDGVLILQKQDLIEKCFPGGKTDKNYLFSLVKLHSPDVQPRQVGVLIDPQCGLQDLINQKIDCVGDPDSRIKEDALRILRALRFAITLNDRKDYQLYSSFDFDTSTRHSLKKYYFLIREIAGERVRQEMVKAAHSNNLYGFVGLLDELHLTKFLFPSVYANKGNDQPIRYHPFDVFHHLLLTLIEVEKLTKDPLVKFAALYHDVGKIEQYYSHTLGLSREEKQEMYGTWVNHVKCGVDMAREDFQKLKFSRKEVDTICWYVAQHMRPGQIALGSKDKWKKKLRLLYSEAGYDRVLGLLMIFKADMAAQYNPLQTSLLDEASEMIRILDQLRDEEGQFTMKQLAVNGNDIMKKFDLEPGPQIKEYLQKAFNRVANDIGHRNNMDSIMKFLDS